MPSALRFPVLIAISAIAALSSAAPAQQPEFYDVPFAPGQWNIGRTLDQSHLRYCVDERDPDWEVAVSIADAIAAGLLLEPQQYVIESDMVREDITKVYQTLLEHCDVQMGFKLIPEGLPEWVIPTRPYYDAQYVFVTSDPDILALGDMPAGRPIGVTMGTSAHLQLLSYNTTLPADNRWPIFPMGTNDLALQSLLNGTVVTALVWAPSLWQQQRENPEIAALRIIDPTPLPATRLGVGGLLLAEQTYLRTAIDEAITALTADGTIGAIIDDYDFVATPAE
ncbi:substrate-binding periplasmic protein [Pelagibacterium sp.]|uniref:substrate-binding periplasmic protein n=1 Tax=Pelagibacterium sp. TaxID=1967288 RepID=UPI003A92A444